MQVIAVIDDEEAFCEVVTSALETCDLMVRCAGTAALGLKILTQEHFDLALIDVDLPDGSGIALAEVALIENIPVLLMTGNLAAIEGLVALGFPVLEKPFPLAQLEIEKAQAMADSRRHIQNARDSIARLRAAIDGLNDARGNSKRLVEVSRGLVDRAVSVTCPSPPATV